MAKKKTSKPAKKSGIKKLTIKDIERLQGGTPAGGCFPADAKKTDTCKEGNESEEKMAL